MDLYVVIMFQSVTVVILFDLGKLLFFCLHCTIYLNLSSQTRDWILGHGSEITGPPGNSQVTVLTSLCPGILHPTSRGCAYRSNGWTNLKHLEQHLANRKHHLRVCIIIITATVIYPCEYENGTNRPHTYCDQHYKPRFSTPIISSEVTTVITAFFFFLIFRPFLCN